MSSPDVSTDIVLVQEFPDLAQAYQVSSVPLTVVEPLAEGAGVQGQGTSILGAQAEAVFLSALAEVGGTGDSPGDGP